MLTIQLNGILQKNLIKEDSNNVNLGGVAGEFEEENEYSAINEVKLGYNATVTEYIGEFDMVINNVAFNLYNKFNKK